MNLMGLSYMYHDSAAALLRDGELVAAAAEERFLRIKHTVDFPLRAIQYVLDSGELDVNDLDAIVFYEKPYLKFERILQTHLAMFPRSWKSFAHFLPMWLNYKLRVPQIIRQQTGYRGKVLFTDHHYAHAASAYLPSPFDEALLLTTDGTGEWSTVAMGHARGTKLSLERDIRFPHSLGLLYSAVTAHLGFKVNGGEGKVMGLASYGDPTRYAEAFKKLIDVKPDGSFKLDMNYFSFHWDLVMTNPLFSGLFGPPRVPESELTQDHQDLAAALQATVEDVMVKLVRHAHDTWGLKDLCVAGGVGLNCVANGILLERTPIERIFVQPGSGDDGGALGAALYAWTQLYGGAHRWRMHNAYLGPGYANEEVAAFLAERAIPHVHLDEPSLVEQVARHIADGKIIGWFQGRMEFGPRALGNRSILADPRRHDMKDILNARVKHREGFRPFAPSVKAEAAHAWFKLPANHDSPFMLLAADVHEGKQDQVPGITHVDGTARVQTVTEAQNARYYRLIYAFEQQTGVPILINTSFNVRGEPIVCTPQHAYDCFMRTEMDYLVLGNYVISKKDLA
ncbi:MAG: carbamoyltransferase [Myxococcota bacterium]